MPRDRVPLLLSWNAPSVDGGPAADV